MSNLIIRGGNKLVGEITPAGNKNAALPIICASLLTNDDVVVRNVPDITDVEKLVDLMKDMGSDIHWDKQKCIIQINNSNFKKDFTNEAFPLGMRGAILLLGPLVTRVKHIEIKEEIGGCSLGIREIDPHLEILQKLGVDVQTNGYIKMNVPKNLKGATLWQEYMSVTTTENFLMASVKAEGTSTMVNAASEPHVQDLCNFLNQMGAKITGIGSSKLTVSGVKHLHGTDFTLSSDHHEITTMLALAAITGGTIEVRNAIPQHF